MTSLKGDFVLVGWFSVICTQFLVWGFFADFQRLRSFPGWMFRLCQPHFDPSDDLFVCLNPAVCSIISTVWFPIGANKEEHLMSFGFSLYSGWVGSALCLLGGLLILCCQGADPGTPSRDNSFYYSGNRGTATLMDPPANHAKSARVWTVLNTKVTINNTLLLIYIRHIISKL